MILIQNKLRDGNIKKKSSVEKRNKIKIELKIELVFMWTKINKTGRGTVTVERSRALVMMREVSILNPVLGNYLFFTINDE